MDNQTAGVDLDKLEALARAAAEYGDAIGEDEWYSADENISVFGGNPDLALIAACSPVAILTLIEQARAARQAAPEAPAEPVAEFIADEEAVGGAKFCLLKPLPIGAKLYAAPTPAAQQAGAAVVHAPIEQLEDEAAVDLFAAAMKEKMEASRAKGRGGWNDPTACSAVRLQTMLVEHVAKGDPVDVGNFAMMLWNRGERTADVGVAFSNDGKELDWDAYAAAEATTASAATSTCPSGDGTLRWPCPVRPPEVAAASASGKWITCPACKGAHGGVGPDGVENDCPRCDNGMVRAVAPGRAQAPSREAAPLDVDVKLQASLDYVGGPLANDVSFSEVRRFAHHFAAALAQQGASHAANAGEDTKRDAKRYRVLRLNVWPANVNIPMTKMPPPNQNPEDRIDFLCDIAIASSAAQEGKA